MSKLELDLSSLTEDKLNALRFIDPQAVAAELAKRNAFGSLDEGFSALAQAVFDLRQVLDNIKQTAAIKAVKACGIITIGERLLAAAEVDDFTIEPPVLGKAPTVVKQKRRTRKGAAVAAAAE